MTINRYHAINCGLYDPQADTCRHDADWAERRWEYNVKRVKVEAAYAEAERQAAPAGWAKIDTLTGRAIVEPTDADLTYVTCYPIALDDLIADLRSGRLEIDQVALDGQGNIAKIILATPDRCV